MFVARGASRLENLVGDFFEGPPDVVDVDGLAGKLSQGAGDVHKPTEPTHWTGSLVPRLSALLWVAQLNCI